MTTQILTSSTSTMVKPVYIQRRDKRLFKKLYAYDGFLTRRQIHDLYWIKANPKTMDRRLTLLYKNGYIQIPTREHRRNHPIPEPIVWLGWRGILYIAEERGITVNMPLRINENHLRKLKKELRGEGIYWHRTPRWSQLSHDIAVNDFRLNVEYASHYYSHLELDTWIPEGNFLSEMDSVNISGKRKGVRPDGFFILINQNHRIKNQPARARFLLEYDNSTHPVSRFGKEKALAGVAYIRSQAYKKRFGFNSGRWLVVCKSEVRMNHLKTKTEQVVGKDAKLFYFTTKDLVTPSTIFNQPIWLQGGRSDLMPLIQDF